MRTLISLVAALVFGALGIQGDQAVAPITSANLKTSLVAAGYTVKEVAPAVEDITLVSGSSNVPTQVELSGNGQYIWAECNFGNLADSDLVDGLWLEALLEANRSIMPCQFNILVQKNGNTTTKLLEVSDPIPNVGMSNPDLKKVLDAFATQVMSQQTYWTYPSIKAKTPGK